MKSFITSFTSCLVLVLAAFSARDISAAGKQLTGKYAPAATPALAPEEAQKKFVVPPGFEVRLFAAEPDIINPVAMTWDERGRLWVVELYEYPNGAKPGTKPRDRIKILEDTTGSGHADKVTVFADGLNLATGIQLGYGGVFVGQAPNLLFLEDTNHDGVADKRTVLLEGFGLGDRHELLNGFTWGPDGWLYMTHGVATYSKVKIPEASSPGIEFTAAVARYHPLTKKFEVFADGTSNPWGVDFDRAGNAFLSACVIDHLFHMAAGGIYVRQGGTPFNPYSYELLPSIVNHKHYMAAFCGIQIYQGNQFPPEWQGEALFGNIHQSAVNHDHLTPNGSSFKANAENDFVTTSDGWFRPVSEQVGPDGALWIADWCDKYPCYQNAQADPEGVDREHGRIWRVVYTGTNSGASVPTRPEVNMDLAKMNSEELVALLAHPNVWQRRMAQRLLTERRDPASARPLKKLLHDGATLEPRLAALWTLHGAGLLDESLLRSLATDKEPAIRTWVARLAGERHASSSRMMSTLHTLANDSDPSVRLAVATAARQFVSGSLTSDEPVPANLPPVNTIPLLTTLMSRATNGDDPLIPFMIWEALEPQIIQAAPLELKWLSKHGAATMPLSAALTRKIIRRLCDTQEPARLNGVPEFIATITKQDTALTAAALDGLLEGQQGKPIEPTLGAQSLIAGLIAAGKPELMARTERLGAIWGDPVAMQNILVQVNNPKLGEGTRLRAIQTASKFKSAAAHDAMWQVLVDTNSEVPQLEAIRALGDIGGENVPAEFFNHWKTFTPTERRVVAETLITRREWIPELLTALENKSVSPNEISSKVIYTLKETGDPAQRQRASDAIGHVYFRIDQEKPKIIAAKKAMILSGTADLRAGHEVARRTCFICHKFYGEGADVGPDLTGVGRSSLDALLANVIDPNQVVAKGFENVLVDTKDGRSLSGRMVENTPTRITLRSAGNKEDVIARSDIDTMRISELSVMPEGLEQMPDTDFRNLIMFILNTPSEPGK